METIGELLPILIVLVGLFFVAAIRHVTPGRRAVIFAPYLGGAIALFCWKHSDGVLRYLGFGIGAVLTTFAVAVNYLEMRKKRAS